MGFGEMERAALSDLIELFAPGIHEAHEALAEVIADTDPDWLSPEGVLTDTLYRNRLVYCDWKSHPLEIRSYLEELPTCPQALTWGWYEWTDGSDWDPEDLEQFLRPLSEKCLELGVALIGIGIDADGFNLGFLLTEDLDRFSTLACTAGIEARIYRPGSRMP
ncbi:DUF6630 family protein [Nocardia heshunensis]